MLFDVLQTQDIINIQQLSLTYHTNVLVENLISSLEKKTVKNDIYP